MNDNPNDVNQRKRNRNRTLQWSIASLIGLLAGLYLIHGFTGHYYLAIVPVRLNFKIIDDSSGLTIQNATITRRHLSESTGKYEVTQIDLDNGEVSLDCSAAGFASIFYRREGVMLPRFEFQGSAPEYTDSGYLELHTFGRQFDGMVEYAPIPDRNYFVDFEFRLKKIGQ